MEGRNSLNIVADLHTHTSASAHAYSTLSEMLDAARNLGHIALAITNHAPAITDGVHRWHFKCMHELPRVIGGVTLIRGVELNVQPDGTVDLDERILKTLDFRIASMHGSVLKAGQSKETNTSLWLSALDNPFVDCLGHCGNPAYEFDHEPVLRRCLETDRIVEINSHSFVARPGSAPNCLKIAKRCMELGLNIAVTSDAHFSGYVGDFSKSIELLEDLHFPEELIVNSSKKRLAEYFLKRRGYNIFED